MFFNGSAIKLTQLCAVIFLCTLTGLTQAMPKPQSEAAKQVTEVAIFAGGCFWCMEQPFDELEGVIETVSGYTGGTVENPSYKQVVGGATGHYEAVKITFDPSKIQYQKLLEVFWLNIDPFDDNGQFCDKGAQYRSAIFFLSESQRVAAEQSRQALMDKRLVREQVATEILPAQKFYVAEDYHQNFYQNNPERYQFYRAGCRRDTKLKALWGDSSVKH